MIKGTSGHSLVEVSVVVAIIAITAALAVPQLTSAGTRFKERAVVAELASELRMARMLALTRGQRVDVRLGPDRQSLELTVEGEPRILLRRYEFLGRGVSVESWPEDRVVRFYPTGRSASPTTISIKGAGTKTWDITVSITGRIGAL